MNSDTPYAQQPGDPPASELFRSTAPSGALSATEDENPGDLRRLRPKLQDALRGLDGSGENDPVRPAVQPGTRIIDRLTETVIRLQDNFVDALYEALKELGFDHGEKLTLRLDDAARLIVGGEHPDSAPVAALLAARADLAAAFAEIAVQSALLRDLRRLQSAAIQASTVDSYMALAASPGRSVYQLSLKGDMNHFYFTG